MKDNLSEILSMRKNEIGYPVLSDDLHQRIFGSLQRLLLDLIPWNEHRAF